MADDLDDLDIPGGYAEDAAATGDVPNLTPDYGTTLLNTNFLPAASTPPLLTSAMDDDDSAFTGLADDTSLGSGLSNLNLNPLISDLGTAANGFLGAYLINPQNAATAEQQAQNTAALAEQQATVTSGLNLASSSQLFTYLLFGLGIFLVFSLIGKSR